MNVKQPEYSNAILVSFNPDTNEFNNLDLPETSLIYDIQAM